MFADGAVHALVKILIHSVRGHLASLDPFLHLQRDPLDQILVLSPAQSSASRGRGGSLVSHRHWAPCNHRPNHRPRPAADRRVYDRCEHWRGQWAWSLLFRAFLVAAFLVLAIHLHKIHHLLHVHRLLASPLPVLDAHVLLHRTVHQPALLRLLLPTTTAVTTIWSTRRRVLA